MLSDEAFENEILAFQQQLEADCNQKVANYVRKLRPNCEHEWVVQLKMRLERLEKKMRSNAVAQTPPQEGSSAVESHR